MVRVSEDHQRHKALVTLGLRLRQEIIDDLKAFAKEDEITLPRYMRSIFSKWVRAKKKLKEREEKEKNVDKE